MIIEVARKAFDERKYRELVILDSRKPLRNHNKFTLDESRDCSTTCESVAKDAEQAFFTCPRFKSSQGNLDTELKTRLTA